MQVNHADQYKLVTLARNNYCRMRADEFLESPMSKMQTFICAAKVNPGRAAKLFYALTATGCVSDVLDMDDLLRQTAEAMADEEWYSHEELKVFA